MSFIAYHMIRFSNIISIIGQTTQRLNLTINYFFCNNYINKTLLKSRQKNEFSLKIRFVYSSNKTNFKSNTVFNVKQRYKVLLFVNRLLNH